MNKEFLNSKKQYVPLVLLGLILVFAVAFFGIKNHHKSLPQVSAATINDYCAHQNPITYGCYKKELTDITNKQGPQQAFALLKQQYALVPYVKSQCHQLTHVIGRAAYAKYNDVGVAFAHGDQFCWAGYYHGLMEALADQKGTTVFLASLNSICAPIEAKGKYSFNHYNCEHGLGHGVMEALNENLFDALGACDLLKEDWNRTSCYGGVFMQNIMVAQSPDESIDHKSAFLKADEPMYPCTDVGDKYKQQCYLMQTSYALQVENYDFTKVFSLCKATPMYRDTCYQSLGRDASGQALNEVQKTKASCLLGPDYDAQSNCIIGASKDFVAYFHGVDQANELCASLPAILQNICFNTVRTYYSTF